MSSSPNALPNSDSHPAPSPKPGLPKPQRVLLDVIRVSKEMTYVLLCQSVKDLSEDDRLTQTELDNALFELVRIGYLSSFFEDGDVVYMLQTTGERPPSKHDEQVLWNPLDAGLEGISLRRSSSPRAKGIYRFDLTGLTSQEQPPLIRRTPTPGIAGIQRFNIPRDVMMTALQSEEVHDPASPSGQKAPRWSRRHGARLNRTRMGHRRSHRSTHNKLSHRGR